MVGHLTASIDVVQRMRRPRDIEMQVLQTGPSTEGVTGAVLQDPDRLRCRGISQQTLLPAMLVLPGDVIGHRIRRLETKSAAWVCRCADRI